MRNFATFEHLDPQRTYVGFDIGFINRMFSQTLTTFPAKSGNASNKLIPDAATDTGKSSDGAKTWSFTLRDGLKWQDGKAVTCEDFKYGVSRTFAVDQITGGPNYAIQWLDIPTNADGTSKYPGPYKATDAQQKMYDKAVVCNGNTITFHLNSPHGDFNQTVYMPAFAAIRKDKDTGAKYDFTPFSDGPYMVQGTFDKDKGGTLVRNPHWGGAAADGGIRKAYPDKVVIKQGDDPATIGQALISDTGDAKNTVTATRIDPSLVAQAESNAKSKDRTVTVTAPYTDYLFFNLTSPQMKNKAVRQAIGMAFDKQAYATASGGAAAMKVADGGVINPTLPAAFKKFNPWGTPPQGDPAKAKQVLQQAGIKTPYPLTYTYRGSPTQDKVSAGIQEALGKAGFKITLKKVPDATVYYSKIQDPNFLKDVDFGWSSWGADWPSGSTVVPALYTSQQVGKVSRGQNYGAYINKSLDKQVDQTYGITDNAQAQQAWSKLDEQVIKDGAVLPVGYNTFTYIQGGNIKGLVYNQAEGGASPDLATIAVK
ncbi:MAG: ABC transporter substrate-binding protein [Streptosporangiales bacterium]|nr:ABC transporter substrate-binding protein [Streptosporangiales bacterium]